jgi:hypothetical protein
VFPNTVVIPRRFIDGWYAPMTIAQASYMKHLE